MTQSAPVAGAGIPDLTCARCGYDLRALDQRRCPECGLPFDPDAPRALDLPWLSRGGRGPLRAYSETVWLALMTPKRIAEHVHRLVEVDPRPMARFRWITIAIATASVVLTWLSVPELQRPAGVIWIFVALVPTCLLYFWVATQWSEMARPSLLNVAEETCFGRLFAFSNAGLAMTPLIPVAMWAAQLGNRQLGFVWWTVAGVLLAWWAGCVRYLWSVGRPPRSESIVYAILLPFFWTITGIFVMAVGAFLTFVVVTVIGIHG